MNPVHPSPSFRPFPPTLSSLHSVLPSPLRRGPLNLAMGERYSCPGVPAAIATEPVKRVSWQRFFCAYQSVVSENNLVCTFSRGGKVLPLAHARGRPRTV